MALAILCIKMLSRKLYYRWNTKLVRNRTTLQSFLLLFDWARRESVNRPVAFSVANCSGGLYVPSRVHLSSLHGIKNHRTDHGHSPRGWREAKMTNTLVSGHNVFVSLPTEAEKSLCYILLPVVLDAICPAYSVVVASPLKAIESIEYSSTFNLWRRSNC